MTESGAISFQMNPTNNPSPESCNAGSNTSRRTARVLCVFVATLIACSAYGLTVIGPFPNWDGSQTAGWAAAAQSFPVPTQDTLLDSFTFRLLGTGTSYEFSLVELAADQPTGPTLYSTVRPWSVGDITISGINLSLNPSQQYAAVIDFQGYTSVSVAFDWPRSSDPYPEGIGYWLTPNRSEWDTFPNADLLFQATFVPEPSAFALLGLGWVALLFAHRRAHRNG